MKFICKILLAILVVAVIGAMNLLWIDFILTADLPTWLKFILLG